MNIFDQYLDKIKNILLDLSKKGNLILPDKLDGITAEIPPSKFNSDISTNVAMVLSKVNKKSPIDLAHILVKAIKLNDELVECNAQKNLAIKDLTGAGDLFAAGYLHGTINNETTKECLIKGTELSSTIIQKIGARI